MLILAAVVGGAIFGALVSLIANLVYLIILFPLVMGAIAGVLVSSTVRSGKIRNPGVAIVGAVLAGFVIYGAMWATDYFQFRNTVKTELLKDSPKFDSSKIEELIDLGLMMETGQSGFVGYVLYQDKQGVSIGRVTSSGKGVNLGPTFSWVYWGIELLIILWVAIVIGKKPASDPFCESCERWYGKEQFLGTLGASRSKELLALVEGGQFAKLGEELQSNPATPNLGVFMATCGKDCTAGEAFLAVRTQTRDSKGNLSTKDLVKGMITSFQMQDLRRGIEARKALYGN
jgi:uncharacterized membrane protein YeaQ/YmgE (transglycosylase-associated protein family)